MKNFVVICRHQVQIDIFLANQGFGTNPLKVLLSTKGFDCLNKTASHNRVAIWPFMELFTRYKMVLPFFCFFNVDENSAF
jgi:hypothetical protein